MNAFNELMSIRNLDKPTESVVRTSADPVLPSTFRLGETNADISLAIGVALNDVWQQRCGRRQDLSVDVHHAAAALRSYMYLSVNDDALNSEFKQQASRQAISTPHPTKDGRFLLPHMGLPHLADRILNILKCKNDLMSIRAAVNKWDALVLEEAIANVDGCSAMVRSESEWLAHPQGKILAASPVIEIIKISDSEPEPLPAAFRPLSGIRVLDLTRILAGPTCARTLAEHGADVLMVTAKHLPQTRYFVTDTSHGKRSTYLDFNVQAERATLLNLIRGTDVFSQGYRPGVMAKHGLSPEELAVIRPGIITTSMNCYGYSGPFADRAGWEQLAQSVTGIADEHGNQEPRLLPAAACDYTTGYLAAYGTILALNKRAKEGGAYHVKTSLCQAGMFIQRQPRVVYKDPTINGVEKIMVTSNTSYGEMKHLGPILVMSETKPHWDLPSSPLGSHGPHYASNPAPPALYEAVNLIDQPLQPDQLHQ